MGRSPSYIERPRLSNYKADQWDGLVIIMGQNPDRENPNVEKKAVYIGTS